MSFGNGCLPYLMRKERLSDYVSSVFLLKESGILCGSFCYLLPVTSVAHNRKRGCERQLMSRLADLIISWQL